MIFSKALTGKTWQQTAYFFGIVLLVWSLPLSKFLMSVAQFIILGSWLLSGNPIEKFRTFFRCRVAVVLSLIFLLHVLGLAWSSDWTYALKDLRIKLPLLALPVIMSSSPALNREQFRVVLLSLIVSCVVAAVIGVVIWAGWTSVAVNDIRDITPFVSHIRLSLLICLAIITALHFVTSEHRYALVLIPATIFLAGFLVLLQSATGIFILGLVMFIAGMRKAFSMRNNRWRWALLTGALALPLVLFLLFRSASDTLNRSAVPAGALQPFTPSGNAYVHDTTRLESENGNRIWVYVCEDELRSQWNQRSESGYDGKDARGQELRYTLIRYLASKGLRKDSSGVARLEYADVKAVESGIANVIYTDHFSLYPRIYELAWEVNRYKHGDNPSGHSLVMRLEYWKTGLHIIGRNPWLGVGTGDVPAAFAAQYEADHSPLDEKWRLRAHNQFITMGVTFGIPGLILFMLILLYTLRMSWRKFDYLFLSFWLIAVVSMFTEDTLETQAGATFFALFYSLFLFVNPRKRVCDGNTG